LIAKMRVASDSLAELNTCRCGEVSYEVQNTGGCQSGNLESPLGNLLP
jgi:hypothetical protein